MLGFEFLEKMAIELQQLWLGTTVFIVIILALSKTTFFGDLLVQKEFSNRQKLILIIIFSAIGIFGTYWGIKRDYGIINTRAVGVIVGGILGGPIVGLFTGLITGIHRMFFLDTFSSFWSGAITVIQGVIAGLLSSRLKRQENIWTHAFIVGFALEVLHMVLLLLFARPYVMAVTLVKSIATSMILTNSIGVALFIGLLEDTYNRKEKYLSVATKISFKTINLMTKVLQEGFNSKTTAYVTHVVMDSITKSSWAAIVDNKEIIAFSSRYNENQDKIKDHITEGHYARYLNHKVCKEEEYITHIFPIKFHDKVVASLIVSKDKDDYFFDSEVELLTGIANLLEMQLEVDNLKEQSMLLSEAELKVLQAQINPHFLFNALNTISFYCRSAPRQAKELVVYLAEYYRHNLSHPDKFISFKDELNHIKAYLTIEKARFGDRLQIKYDIDVAEEFMIPSLILQPLVENAIKHGVLTKEEGGTIFIGIIPMKDQVKLYVSDNGVGIPKEKLDTILEEKFDEESKRKSIGLLNVHQRLITVYGEESGLNIVSAEGVGTTVSFKIIRKGEQRNAIN